MPYAYLSPTRKSVNLLDAVVTTAVGLAAAAIGVFVATARPALWGLWLAIAVGAVVLCITPLFAWRGVLARSASAAMAPGVLDVVPIIKGDFPHDESGMERMFATGWLRFDRDGITVVSSRRTTPDADATSIVAFLPYRDPLLVSAETLHDGRASPRLRLASGEEAVEVEVMVSANAWRGASLDDVSTVAARLRTSVVAVVAPGLRDE